MSVVPQSSNSRQDKLHGKRLSRKKDGEESQQLGKLPGSSTYCRQSSLRFSAGAVQKATAGSAVPLAAPTDIDFTG